MEQRQKDLIITACHQYIAGICAGEIEGSDEDIEAIYMGINTINKL